jgi:hypothetical protein
MLKIRNGKMNAGEIEQPLPRTTQTKTDDENERGKTGNHSKAQGVQAEY